MDEAIPQPTTDDLEVAAPIRRSPFAENPVVGQRGMQTHQRILDAALEVFGQTGYEACRVERITEVAGCSRPSFYQYFSSKEEVFRQLAGQVAVHLRESAEALAEVTPDPAGWDALRHWIERYAEIYDRYEPVFAAFAVAASADVTVATGAARVRDRHVAAVAGKIRATRFPKNRANDIVAALLNMLAHTNRFRSLLDGASRSVTLPRRRVNDALADVVHRTLFGVVPGVNVRETRLSKRTVTAPAGMAVPAVAAPDDGHRRLGPAGREMRKALLRAGAQVFVARGYHATRVDDITEAAGVSHGAFYKYFPNKDAAFRILAARAGNRVVDAFERLPDVAAHPDAPETAAALATWLREYARTYEQEGAIIRVWTEAMARDPELNAFSVAALDRLRRRAARFLMPRAFGDIDADALVLLALVEGQQPVIGASRDGGRHVAIVTDIVRFGLLGAHHPPA